MENNVLVKKLIDMVKTHDFVSIVVSNPNTSSKLSKSIYILEGIDDKSLGVVDGMDDFGHRIIINPNYIVSFSGCISTKNGYQTV